MLKRTYVYAIFLLAASFSFSGYAPPNVPFADTIVRIMDGMEYSGYHVIIKPGVDLKIDFDDQTWTLRNVYAFDAQGKVLLEKGRYGLCARLATYMYNQLKPLIKDSTYDLKFANVVESDFFSQSQSNHIALLMMDKQTQDVYLLDPSFHKFGHLSNFPEYKVLALQDSLAFVRDKSVDITFHRDQAMPLFVKKDVLVSFAVTSVDGKFDKDNYLLVISVNRRHDPEILDIAVLGKYEGEVREVRRSKVLEQLFNPEEFLELYKKMNQWVMERN